MRLRKTLVENIHQVEVKRGEHWVPLNQLNTLENLAKKYNVKGNLASCILSVLELGEKGWHDLDSELSEVILNKNDIAAPQVILPIKPKSFRDFMLFEDHCIDSTRGYVKRFMPRAYRVSSIIESITNKPFSKFHPHSLWYKQPIYYFGNHLNFLTDGDSIPWPSHTNALDYELELGAIRAKPLKNATTEEARDAIGGYVVLNDVSARDVQKDEMDSGFGPQRAKHFINCMSAEVVTADEGRHALKELSGNISINNINVSECNGVYKHFSLQEAIAFCSKDEWLHSGELFGTGTIPGGSGLENGVWLKSNDSLTLSIDGIGSITNQIKSN